jgi:predicted nucleic acid-binding protein
MSGSVSPSEQVVADTVVVNYFLALGRFALLTRIVGGHVFVPRAVYDPDDAGRALDAGLSELEVGLRQHRSRAEDDELPPRKRERSREALPHFEQLPQLVSQGLLMPLELTPTEIQTYAMFRDHSWGRQHGLLTGLGFGEAAALAVAESRGMRLATDDEDCIRVATARNPQMRIERIRGLLQSAVDRNFIGLNEARSVHLAMVAFGFYDRGRL